MPVKLIEVTLCSAVHVDGEERVINRSFVRSHNFFFIRIRNALRDTCNIMEFFNRPRTDGIILFLSFFIFRVVNRILNEKKKKKRKSKTKKRKV